MLLRLGDKNFEPFITHEQIMAAVNGLAARLRADYGAFCLVSGVGFGAPCADSEAGFEAPEPPIFVGVLNGAFMVMAALMQQINLLCEVSFVKLSSYVGTASLGAVSELIGLDHNVRGRRVVVVEDIVETGLSTGFLVDKLLAEGAADVQVAALFLKPDLYRGERPVKYVGMHIANEFIVGFGLDYNGLGRNFPEVYKVVEGER